MAIVAPVRANAFLRTLRIARVGVHILWGAFQAATLLPFVGRRTRGRLVGHWSRRLVAILGVRLRVIGTPQPGGVVYVLNHISWLDIHVLHAVADARFISKSEVRAWPVIGWLAHQAGTLFVERGRKHDTLRVNREATRALAQGEAIALFPEGTTTDGTRVLSFKASLLQAAVDADVPLAPAALRYLDHADRPTTVPAYIDDMNFGESLTRIVAAPGVTAEIHFLGTLPSAGRRRRDLAAEAHRVISATLESARR